MKKLRLAFWALSFSAITFLSCDKNSPDINPPPQNIADYIAGNPDFSIMESALVRAGLVSELQNATNLTFFLPDNAAFQNAGLDQNAINAMTTAQLTDLIHYHEVNHVINSAQFPIGDTITTILGLHIFSNIGDSGIYLNGIKIKTTDIQATNGIVHLLTKALIPPAFSVYDLVASDPDFTLLKAAIDKAGLTSTLQNGGVYTLFAPNNTAFNNAGYNTVTDINNADPAAISKIVKDHVLSTEFFLSDFVSGLSLKNIQGDDLIVSKVPPSINLVGSSQPNAVVIVPDMLGTNGVIQEIDRVILP